MISYINESITFKFLSDCTRARAQTATGSTSEAGSGLCAQPMFRNHDTHALPRPRNDIRHLQKGTSRILPGKS